MDEKIEECWRNLIFKGPKKQRTKFMFAYLKNVLSQIYPIENSNNVDPDEAAHYELFADSKSFIFCALNVSKVKKKTINIGA